MSYLREKTRYDQMLDILLFFAAQLRNDTRRTVCELVDRWSSSDIVGILNGPATNAKEGPATQAHDVILWLTNGGKRPEWLHSISDEELLGR